MPAVIPPVAAVISASTIAAVKKGKKSSVENTETSDIPPKNSADSGTVQTEAHTQTTALSAWRGSFPATAFSRSQQRGAITPAPNVPQADSISPGSLHAQGSASNISSTAAPSALSVAFPRRNSEEP